MKKNKQWRIKIRYFKQQYGLIIALVIAIFISIFLSVQLWQSPTQSTQNQQSDETNQENVAGKDLTDVYSVSQITYNHGQKKLSVIDYRTLASKMINRVQTWSLSSKGSQVVKKQAYINKLARDNVVVMSFPDSVSGSIVKKIFGKQIKLPNNAMINHVQLPRNKGNRIAFYDDRHRKIYTFQATNMPQKIQTRPNNKKVVTVEYEWLGKSVMAATTESTTFQSYSYLLDVDSTISRLTKLFPDSGTREVNHSQEILTYTNDNNRRMQHNVTTGVINYDAYGIHHNVDTFNQRQYQSYRWLTTLHQLSDNLYYFEQQNRGQTLTYRLFVNGLPIFNQSTDGTVQVKQLPNQHEEIVMSQYSLRVPLPTDQKNKVILAPMTDAMAKLESVGVSKDDIEQMSIGYRWQLNTDNQIVTLQPEWYFEQGHVWQSVNDQVNNEERGH